jgi:hypothetical protein
MTKLKIPNGWKLAPVVQAEQDPVAFTAQTAPDGLYVVLFRDNCYGDGDTYHLLGRKRNGVWFADESGRELFEYEGDAILRIWPLDANAPPAHPDAALVEALRSAIAVGRRAIGDHSAPHDCYATGPMTGDPFRDLVECPACAALAEYDRIDAALAGKGGES